MKRRSNILFIHISDIHLGSRDDLPPSIINGIVKTVGEASDYEASFIVLTGDIVNSGNFDEYANARKALEMLIQKLRNKNLNPRVLLVPGNHDIQIPPDRNYGKVRRLIEDSSKDRVFNDDMGNMNPFFDFAKEYNLFSESRVRCSVSESIESCPGDIEFTLLNTAPFSTREADDKELHYFPDNDLFELRKNASSWLKVVLMHHSPDWFEGDSKLALENYLSENCDVVFVGHEHDSYVEQRLYSFDDSILMIRGGELRHSSFDDSSFSKIVLDCNASKMHITQYVWNRHPGIFIERNNDEVSLIPKIPEVMEPSADYLEKLNTRLELLDASIEDIFVFPEFRVDIGSDDQKESVSIQNENDFWDEVDKSRLVCIVGGQQAGKTTLLKHLYRQCNRRGYSPLFFGKENAGLASKRLISSLVQEQYGDGEVVSNRYAQMPRSRKVLFIDDFDSLKTQYASFDYLDSLLDDVQCIVFTSSKTPDESIIDRIKSSLGSRDHAVVLALKDFYKVKRGCLIDKVCTSSGATHEQSDEIIAIMDRSVHSHRRLSDLSPDFIIRSTVYYLDKGVDDRAEEAPFGVIFEANISKGLEASFRNNPEKPVEQLVKESLVYLGAIAFRMHEKRVTTLATEEIQALIDDYCSSHLLTVDYRNLFEAFQKSGLLVMDSAAPEWRFSTENYLAYFVARWLNLQISIGRDVTKELSRLVSGICFDINESILLFLSYLRNDTRFPLVLCTAADDAIDESELLSFDEGTVSFLALPEKSAEIHMASEQGKEKADHVTAQMEEELDDGRITYRGAYEYTDEEARTIPNRILRSVKCLQMVGKSLVSQNEIIDATSKDLIIDALFEVPNKILYTMLHPVDEQYDEVVEFVIEQLKDDPTMTDCTEEEVREQISFLCLSICLSLYDSIAFCSSSRGTGHLFQRSPKTDTNTRIQKLSMMSHALSSEDFINYAISMMDHARKSKNLIEINSIRLIVNHYLYQHRGISRPLLQKCSKKVFDEENYSRRILKNRNPRFE